MPTPHLHVVQLSPTAWLILDEMVRARWLIVRGPLVNRHTGETHVMDRVELWSHEKERRVAVSVHDGLEAAKGWCREELAAEQRVRAEHSGVDPVTREPLYRRTSPTNDK